MMSRMCLLAVMPIVLAGCMSAGEAREQAPRVDRRPQVESITLCQTTGAELRNMFGNPTRDGRLRNARVLSWVVDESDAGIVQYLAVLLDARDRVVDLYWDLPTEIPWTPTDQCKRG